MELCGVMYIDQQYPMEINNAGFGVVVWGVENKNFIEINSFVSIPGLGWFDGVSACRMIWFFGLKSWDLKCLLFESRNLPRYTDKSSVLNLYRGGPSKS